jgi:hypothetical protein
MDAAALMARLEAARTYEETVEGARFTVRRPTVDAYRQWCVEHRVAGEEARVDVTAMSRARMPACIVGWQGVTLRHFGGGSDEAVAYSPEAAALLFADAPAIELALFSGMVRRVRERVATLEPDEKNSSSASAPV